MDGQRQRIRPRAAALPPALSEPEREGLLRAPDGLPPGARACWEAWAASAIAERTLTPSTAVGFAEACRRGAYVADLAAKIDRLGAETQEALPTLVLYDRLAQKLEGSLARFKLTAFGKPATSDQPQPKANPWEQLAAK